jgi:hypothetical protein
MAARMRSIARALPLLVPLLASGCGGSSSETPPPLEPDPESGRYTGPRVDADEPARLKEPEPLPEEEPLSEQPRRPAAATWGSGKPAPATATTVSPAQPAPAPSMTSPTALPPKSKPAN